MDGINRYFQPNTLDGLSIYESILPGEPLYVDGSNAMQADANMGGFNVKNVADATTADEAVNLGQFNIALAGKADTSYVNTQLALKANDVDVVHKAGSETITGSKTFTSTVLVSRSDPHVSLSTTGGTASDIAVTDAAGSMLVRSRGNLHLQTVNSNNFRVFVGAIERFRVSTGEVSATLNVNVNNNKITSLANGTAATDAVAYGQLTNVDANVVHLTGNETVGGIKTFTSSPIVPVQPTLLTEASSQKMVASLRPVSWCHKMYCYEQTSPSQFGTVTYTRQVAYSPFEIGSVPLAQRGVGTNSVPQELWISSTVMHAGLPLTGMIVRASNIRNAFGTLQQRPQVRVGIWDPDSGALVASSVTLELKLQTPPAPNVTQFENFYIPFQSVYTPSITKRFVYGIWWEAYVNFIQNNNVVMTTQSNNGDLFQTGYTGNSQASAYKTGITVFPTTLPAAPYTIYTPGLICMFVTFDSSAVW